MAALQIARIEGMAGFVFLYVVAFANLALGFWITVRLWPKSAPRD